MRVRRRVLAGLLGLVIVALAITVRPSTVGPFLVSALTGPWFPLVLLGLYAVRPFLGWPIVAISALVGFRYGVVVGVPIALAGAIATSLVPYAAGRLTIEASGLLARFSAGSDRYFRRTGGFRGLVAARLAPLPAEPVSAAAGAGNVSLQAFVLATAVGELPWTLAAVSVGHSMTAFAFEGMRPDWWLVGVGVLGAVVLLAGPAYRSYRTRR